MAGIDHTCIVFKNGNYIPENEYSFYDENDEYIYTLPFKYGRDGDIRYINGVDITHRIKWLHDEYEAVYNRAGIRELKLYRLSFWSVWNWLKWKLHVMERSWSTPYTREVGIYTHDDVEVYIYHDAPNQSYISFYKDSTDTYVIIGGYGHHNNVYTHFMGRGYGDEFERKMAVEAYWWACDDILEMLVESYCPGSIFDIEDETNRLRKMFMPKNIYYERYSYGYWPDDLWEDDDVT